MGYINLEGKLPFLISPKKKYLACAKVIVPMLDLCIAKTTFTLL
jgi:hypothetical protein